MSLTFITDVGELDPINNNKNEISSRLEFKVRLDILVVEQFSENDSSIFQFIKSLP